MILVYMLLLPVYTVQAQAAEEPLTLYFFYSPTCPHCIAEWDFLDSLPRQYPDLKIIRYQAADLEHRELLLDLLRQHNAERYLGSVPMTFVGEDFMLGFDNPESTGQAIIASIERQLGIASEPTAEKSEAAEAGDNTASLPLSIPFIGSVDPSEHSLSVLAAILGFIDGFNVCSLGALALIMGLVLALGSRKKIALLGGVFLLVTALVYAGLIFLWHQLFVFFAPHIRSMEYVVGGLAIIGGLYMIREFWHMKKHGAVCTVGGKTMSRLSARVSHLFKTNTGLVGLSLGVLIFAAAVAIIEFPCSAAVPVVFAALLSDLGLSTGAYAGYIALFVLFYLLDELILFAVAVWKLEIWLTSPKFVIIITGLGGAVLLYMGLSYIAGI